MKSLLKLLLLCIVAISATSGAAAQGSDSIPEQPVWSLLTVAPGNEVYELDGHTGLRYRGTDGTDFVVNWGVFDFNSPNFLYRFVKGETDYIAAPAPTMAFLLEYMQQGRQVTEQVLDLTPAQSRMLESYVSMNLRPENRSYRYNYIYDNCATRPLKLIEAAVGTQISLPDDGTFIYGDTGIADDSTATHTFRGEMTRSHADYPWYQLGIDLALGCGLDSEITSRQRIYSPLYLCHVMRHATYTLPGREPVKLVRETRVIVSGNRASQPATPFLLTPLFWALVILAASMAVAFTDWRRRHISRWVDSLFFSLIFITSLVLTFLIFVSVHEATSPNWLYLWINPLAIIPAALIWIKRCKRAVYCYQICNFAALSALLVVAALGVQALNKAFYPLIAADMLLAARYILIYSRK